MSLAINFGIDLGTTNSLIAKYEKGVAEIFRNPMGFKETLPSVVGFRKERIIVGDKAREYLQKDPENVFSAFKRKMGTSETFFVPSIDGFQTPIELSSKVLMELKNFIPTGESPQAVVVTIPASFDTIQSNATKKAGYLAGFKEVVLLQEPIAAILAFLNKKEDEQKEGKWLVYDLGGGTFDVALVSIDENEMKVVDHLGDNFLGGVDFDASIITQLIIPKMNELGGFKDLESEMKSSRGKYNKLYQILLGKAEEAKIALSNYDSIEIEFETEDDLGEDREIIIEISREQFENIVKDRVNATIAMMEEILEKNSLNASEINEIIMIGGSTYLPYVRENVSKNLSIPANFSIDPTTAVALGAAYYAGTKNRSILETEPTKDAAVAANTNYEVKTAYAKNSFDNVEYFTAKIKGELDGINYRITRSDGGYDSGLKKLEEQISEMLRLVPDSINSFDLKLYDQQNSLIFEYPHAIEIVQGKYSVSGQPIPNDICLEVDDTTLNQTTLEVIFEKNAILPLRKSVTRVISRTILKGSEDAIIINILEGDRLSSPTSNLPIGVIEIKGNELNESIIKGSDIEIELEMSESRDLKIMAYLTMGDQEFVNLFNPSERNISVLKLKDEIKFLLNDINKEIISFNENEEYELSSKLKRIQQDLIDAELNLDRMSEFDTTDERYQIEDLKRKSSKQFDKILKEIKLSGMVEEYFHAKASCESYLSGTNEYLKNKYENLIKGEKNLLNSGSRFAFKKKIGELNTLFFRMAEDDPQFLTRVFYHFSSLPIEEFSKRSDAERLFKSGEMALERQNYIELKIILGNLNALLPGDVQDARITGTGIG